jgi:hypothetical protein
MQEEREYLHWRLIYGAVILFTVLVLVLLWAFSKAFE